MRYAVVALALGLTLAGCSDRPADLSLVESKSTVQLLRNETAQRVPTEVLLSVVKEGDVSEACDIGDPIRRWRSSVLLNISAQHADEAPRLFEELAAGYVEEGWHRGSVGSRQAVLSRDDSIATIDILMTEDADGDGDGASIRVLVTGPCVPTDGEGSDEVVSLEAR